MGDIIVKSKLDVKTYFGINILIFFKLRTVIILTIYFLLVEYLVVFERNFEWWMEIFTVLIFAVFYGGIIPLVIYLSGIKRSKNSAAFLENLVYILSEEKIEVKGETISGTNSWKYISKIMEREKYFLLMSSPRTFSYLPKAGFGSAADITRFKTLVKEKGIKMKYH